MRGNFLTFIRRHFIVVIVFTFAANMIMFSAILRYTGSTPSEQDTNPFVKHRNLHNYDTDKWTKNLENNTYLKQKRINSKLKEHVENLSKRKKSDDRESKHKGQLDYMPANEQRAGHGNKFLDQSNQIHKSVVKAVKKKVKSRKQTAIEEINAKANAKAAKVYHLYDDYQPAADNIQVINYKENDDNSEKAPKTFNAKYIEYFWRHPELHNKQDTEKMPTAKLGKAGNKPDEKTSKNINKNLANSQNKGIKTESKVKIKENFKEYKGKSDVIKFQKHNQDQLLPNVSYITMFPAKGQLGNQMFQLASLLGIAENSNSTPFLPMFVFDLNKVFRLPNEFIKDADVSEFDHFTENASYQNESIKQSQHLDRQRNWILDGYFQSFKYFCNVSEKVRKYLRFHKYLLVHAVEFLQKTVPEGHVKVAIHIRRGDFINPYQMKLGRVLATAGYVQRAKKYFESRYRNITFVVVSDDMNWCRENIKGDNVKYSTSNYNRNGLDLAIISRCDHAIISVGTFGWWGGWLSGGTVVYYNKFPRPGSELDRTFIPKNYYPSQWIGLD